MPTLRSWVIAKLKWVFGVGAGWGGGLMRLGDNENRSDFVLLEAINQ